MRISDWSSDVCSSDLAYRHDSQTGVRWQAAKALGELVRHFGTRGTKESVAQLREAMTALARDPHPNIQSYAAALGQTIRRLEGTPRSEARRVGEEGVGKGRTRGTQ